MRKTDIKNVKPAKKYAKALMETALSENKTQKVSEDLKLINDTLNENADLRAFMTNPVIPASDKKDVIQKLFAPHCDKISTDFFNLLADNSRFSIINEITAQCEDLFDEANGIAKPVIITAIEPEEYQKHKIEEMLAAKLNKTIYPEYVVNPGIIGGLIIKIGDKTTDCSLKAKFDNMKKQLTKGNNYGNN